MTASPSAQDLIDTAEAALNPIIVGERLFGDVAATLVTPAGNLYTGVCLDTPSWGLCAERSAIAAMVTAREYRIARIVAVWREWRGAGGPVHVLAPCGTCREFMRQVHPENLDTEIVLGLHESMPLRQLLPVHDWLPPLEP